MVWTDRMLTALEEGVKGDVWFSLMDKVYASRGLRAAWDRVRANHGSAGVDRETVERFSRKQDAGLEELGRQLREGSYQPLPVRRVYIPKPDGRQRPLGIPAVKDRVVQASLRQVLEPIFEAEFAEHSYGFRPGRGAKDALRRVDRLLKEGYAFVVDADLKSYFDTIPHDRLMTLVRQRVADGRVLSLVEAFLNQGVLEDMKEWKPTAGTPQGAVISPLLSNLYLHPLDVLMWNAGYEMTRYADDFVVQCRTADEAERAMAMIRAWVEEVGLTLHPQKTRIVEARENAFEFLGYRFERGRHGPRAGSLKKFKDTIRTKTRRNNGQSMTAIIGSVNRTTRGWFAYFQHSPRTIFGSLDGWIRMRLRSILRRRHGRRGRGRGTDHNRWTNAFFVDLGFFSMQAAHVSACQSR